MAPDMENMPSHLISQESQFPLQSEPECFDNVDILSTIFSNLDYEDFLQVRKVSRLWNAVIAGSGSSHLWSKACISIKSSESVNPKFKWTELIRMVSGMRYPCPRYSIHGMDLRIRAARDFFLCNGSFITSLHLYKCILSTFTFHQILALCTHLESLEVFQVPPFMMAKTNDLNPRNSHEDLQFKMNSGASLGNLISLTLSAHAVGNPPKDFDFDLDGPILLEVLTRTPGLEKLCLIGWGASTVTNVFFGLGSHPFLSHLALEKIPDPVKFDLKELSTYTPRKTHLNDLKYFALTFFPRALVLPSQNNHGLRIFVQKFLKAHGHKLIELNLSYCPVNVEIFHYYKCNFPNLKRLNLRGTGVKGKDIHNFEMVMPCLEFLELGEECIPPQSLGDYTSQDYIDLIFNNITAEYLENRDYRPVTQNYFHQCSAFDELCLRSLAPVGIIFLRHGLSACGHLGPIGEHGLIFALAVVNILPIIIYKYIWGNGTWTHPTKNFKSIGPCTSATPKIKRNNRRQQELLISDIIRQSNKNAHT